MSDIKSVVKEVLAQTLTESKEIKEMVRELVKERLEAKKSFLSRQITEEIDMALEDTFQAKGLLRRLTGK